MALTLITAPATEPIDANDASTHCRLETGSDDTYVGKLIVAARRHVEKVTDWALITQTWELTLDEFPDVIRLAKGQTQSVTSIKYLDTDGVEQTLDSSLYTVDTASIPARIVPAYDEEWPDTREQINAVKVRFVVGFGDAADVPENVKHAIRLLVGHWYENRELQITGTIANPVQFAFDALLAGLGDY